MDVVSFFGPRHPAHVDDLSVAVTAARTAHAALAALFIGTMIAFTALRFAGLKRLLVKRSGVIGLGVGWTILTGVFFSWKASDLTSLVFAPGTPPHALVVVFPAQMAFFASLVKRKQVPSAHALRAALAFAFALGALCLARAVSAGDRETVTGAKRGDGSFETLDVGETTVDVLIALARAGAGVLLVLAGGERETGDSVAEGPSKDGAKGKDKENREGKNKECTTEGKEKESTSTEQSKESTDKSKESTKGKEKKSPEEGESYPKKTTAVGSRRELFLSTAWCFVVISLSPPRLFNETAFGDCLGGNVFVEYDDSKGSTLIKSPLGRKLVWRFVARSFLFVTAHWAGLLVVKLSPGKFKNTETGKTKKER
jgi:hypothetical protein